MSNLFYFASLSHFRFNKLKRFDGRDDNNIGELGRGGANVKVGRDDNNNDVMNGVHVDGNGNNDKVIYCLYCFCGNQIFNIEGTSESGSNQPKERLMSLQPWHLKSATVESCYSTHRRLPRLPAGSQGHRRCQLQGRATLLIAGSQGSLPVPKVIAVAGFPSQSRVVLLYASPFPKAIAVAGSPSQSRVVLLYSSPAPKAPCRFLKVIARAGSCYSTRQVELCYSTRPRSRMPSR
jgi:hypothetical protein